jgi:hypothetical protein
MVLTKDLIYECVICNNKFYTRQYYKKTCSNECLTKLRGLLNTKYHLNTSKYKNKDFQCENCNKKFINKTWHQQKYCSKKCQVIVNARKQVGSKWPLDRKLHMSKIMKGKLLNRKHIKYEYNNNYYRSGWEIEVSKFLDNHNIKFEYEKYCFKLTKNIYYWPDFYLPNERIFIEVKGWWDEKSKIKRSLFKQYCREHNFEYIIIDYNNYNEILNNTFDIKNCYNPNAEELRYEEYMCGVDV